ncbi:hypothetical protein [Lentzea atacamensis]|nr:hypothetical protein [Lentzea atacamensis]
MASTTHTGSAGRASTPATAMVPGSKRVISQPASSSAVRSSASVETSTGT